MKYMPLCDHVLTTSQSRLVMADVRYGSGGTADIVCVRCGPMCAISADSAKSSSWFAPVAKASDEQSVASWAGTFPSETLPAILSRSLSSGLAVNNRHHPNRTRARHNSSIQTGRNSSSSAGLLLGNNLDPFPAESSGVGLSASFSNNPITRFYFDAEQPWAPPGLGDPVPNAPARRNAVSQQHSTNFDLRGGPRSDLGSATSDPDSGYASRIVDSQSCRSGEVLESAGQIPELLNPFDSFQSFPNMSAFPPTPRSDGADSQQMNNATRANGSLEPCPICGVQSKCPSDFK